MGDVHQKMLKVCRAQHCKERATKELAQVPVCRTHYDNTLEFGRPLILKAKGKGTREAIA